MFLSKDDMHHKKIKEIFEHPRQTSRYQSALHQLQPLCRKSSLRNQLPRSLQTLLQKIRRLGYPKVYSDIV